MTFEELQGIYRNAQGGNVQARQFLDAVQARKNAGDPAAARLFDALQQMHWQTRAGSEWTAAKRIFVGMARNDPKAWTAAKQVAVGAEKSDPKSSRLFSMMRTLHNRRKLSARRGAPVPETGSLNVKARDPFASRRAIFGAVSYTPTNQDWVNLAQLIQAAIASVPGGTASTAPPQPQEVYDSQGNYQGVDTNGDGYADTAFPEATPAGYGDPVGNPPGQDIPAIGPTGTPPSGGGGIVIPGLAQVSLPLSATAQKLRDSLTLSNAKSPAAQMVAMAPLAKTVSQPDPAEVALQAAKNIFKPAPAAPAPTPTQLVSNSLTLANARKPMSAASATLLASLKR